MTAIYSPALASGTTEEPMELAAIVGMCGLSLALGVGGTRAIFGAMFLMMPARASEDRLSAPSV
jgi:hypothetical protein